MQKYTFSPGNTLSDCYTLDGDGKHFSVSVRNGIGARFYGDGKGHATEFVISDGGYRAMADGTFTGTDGESTDVGELGQFYKEMSESLKKFSTQILGIGVPESITGMPTRRRVRRDLKRMYVNALAKALESAELELD